MTHPGGAYRQYEYTGGNPAHLISITDENNAAYATWTYDGNNKVSLSKHNGGRREGNNYLSDE